MDRPTREQLAIALAEVRSFGLMDPGNRVTSAHAGELAAEVLALQEELERVRALLTRPPEPHWYAGTNGQSIDTEWRDAIRKALGEP